MKMTRSCRKSLPNSDVTLITFESSILRLKRNKAVRIQHDAKIFNYRNNRCLFSVEYKIRDFEMLKFVMRMPMVGWHRVAAG
jgi:hypothetical protein